jgi:hypothetical protein
MSCRQSAPDKRYLKSERRRSPEVDHFVLDTVSTAEEIVVLTALRAILMRYLSFRAHRPEAFGHAVPSESSPSD